MPLKLNFKLFLPSKLLFISFMTSVEAWEACFGRKFVWKSQNHGLRELQTQFRQFEQNKKTANMKNFSEDHILPPSFYKKCGKSGK